MNMQTTTESLTPMLKQYLRIKSEYEDAILMFRLGDFYEMFFEDAVLASKILDITLTSRNRNDPNPVPLCGVPYHSVEPYIAKLLESGKRVAICDQVEDPKLAKGVVKREVTRVITPGVVADALGLDASNYNYLASVYQKDAVFGIAAADISTGAFFAAEMKSKDRIIEELGRIEPKEIILDRQFAADDRFKQRINRQFPAILFTVVDDQRFDSQNITHLEDSLALIGTYPTAAIAAGGVFSYLKSLQKGKIDHIRELKILSSDRVMRMDEATKRNLELVRTLRDGTRSGSVLDTIDKTSTASGARKLKNWLLYPLTDRDEICERLDAVETIINEHRFLKCLPDVLSRIADIERITSRASMGLANARDMIGLKESLVAITELKSLLGSASGRLSLLGDAIDPHKSLIEKIEKSILDEPPITLREGGLIKVGVSAELDELRDIIAHGKDYIARLETKEREATGISSLKIRYNKVFGYYLEVTNTHKEKVPDSYIRKQTLANAERYITPDLKEYEEKILGAQEKSRALEYELFQAVREEVETNSKTLLATADVIATVDVLTSHARISAESNFKRPKIDNDIIIDIKDGRHPIVERQNPLERFVPNDVYIDDKDTCLLIITGPNMAGKSTVMRQTALIVLFAQIGLFVPATEARIGITDRIFTRVGASDALSQGQSTFMVEMSETAIILREATGRSLIIIDEIGRGTSTFDGLAIAWAVAEDLHDRVRARTMFATHYHELTDLALTKTGVHNMQISVKEWNNEVIFLRRLISGAASRSYGIAVARLAGLPEVVLERSKEVLENLENGELDEVGKPKIALHHKPEMKDAGPVQFQLFSKAADSEIRKRLNEIDTTTITPIEALNLLHELKNKN